MLYVLFLFFVRSPVTSPLYVLSTSSGNPGATLGATNKLNGKVYFNSYGYIFGLVVPIPPIKARIPEKRGPCLFSLVAY